MYRKTIDFLKSVPATMVGGAFLLISLFLPIFGIELPWYLDPAWIPFVISGIPLIDLAAGRIIRNKGISKISSALLISIAMFAAIGIKDIFAAGEVAFIMALGEILEDKTTEKAKRGLKNLISLTPATGRIIKDGKEEIISAEEIKIGDILRIIPGEAIPVDGQIISGETSIDQSIMTGESLPVDKAIGDDVFCGTMNRFGSIDIRATKVGEDSSLQKLIRMVKDAEGKKAPIQRITDKWASRLVPAALLIAIIAGLVKQDIVVAVTVLVVFCPCALVLATPTAIMAAIGQATKHGIIIKSGEALEKMGKVDTVAFDKTGTLTYGKLEVSDIIPMANINGNELLCLAATAESRSEHPLGKAITQKAKKEGIGIKAPEEFRMTAGRGIFAVTEGSKIYCGNEKYIQEQGIFVSADAENKLSDLREQGKASVIVADGENILGIIALSDIMKPEAKEMAEQLRKTNVSSVLLTGDNEKTARYFGDMAGIKHIYSGLLPEEKVMHITEMQNTGKNVCMIGDGVNDAPALKTADVGIAMGTMGSDIAVQSADIAIMGDDISKIPYLKRLSDATSRTIRISITMSLFINFLAIILSFFGILNPTTGALVHNAGSLVVIMFAALLYDRKFDK